MTRTNITKEELIANGGTRSLMPKQYRGLSKIDRVNYGKRQTHAIGRILQKRKGLNNAKT